MSNIGQVGRAGSEMSRAAGQAPYGKDQITSTKVQTSTKSQAPNLKQEPNGKTANSKRRELTVPTNGGLQWSTFAPGSQSGASCLELVIWNLEFVWDLVLVIWSFRARSARRWCL
jgi:hypothetical protein